MYPMSGVGGCVCLSRLQVANHKIGPWPSERYSMALDTKAHLLRIARGLFPVIVFFATLIVGIKLGAFDDSLAGYVTSPLQAIFGLGLPLFSGGTFIIFQGLLNRVMAKKSKSWPTVNGEVIVSNPAPAFIGLYLCLWGPLIRFRYIVNGQLY